MTIPAKCIRINLNFLDKKVTTTKMNVSLVNLLRADRALLDGLFRAFLKCFLLRVATAIILTQNKC